MVQTMSARGIVAIVAAAFALPAASAQGAARTPPPPGVCPSAPSETAAIRDIDSSGDITLHDGRVVTLAGIETPPATSADPDRADKFRDRLKALFAGGFGFAALGGTDRWGRIPVAPFAAGANAAVTLLLEGAARYRPGGAARACHDILLGAETDARDRRRGVWSDPDLTIVSIGDARPSLRSGFVVVEGAVAHVAETPARIYLDLGRSRGGFALSASKRDIGLMRSEALIKARIVGARVRARGLIDGRFGGRMDLVDSDSLELVAPAPGRAEP
jgi:endonuclease YncB( thermonuclease family)